MAIFGPGGLGLRRAASKPLWSASLPLPPPLPQQLLSSNRGIVPRQMSLAISAPRLLTPSADRGDLSALDMSTLVASA